MYTSNAERGEENSHRVEKSYTGLRKKEGPDI